MKTNNKNINTENDDMDDDIVVKGKNEKEKKRLGK